RHEINSLSPQSTHHSTPQLPRAESAKTPQLKNKSVMLIDGNHRFLAEYRDLRAAALGNPQVCGKLCGRLGLHPGRTQFFRHLHTLPIQRCILKDAAESAR